jgi:glycosyltransferase involved in cell wall biosynthesis
MNAESIKVIMLTSTFPRNKEGIRGTIFALSEKLSQSNIKVQVVAPIDYNALSQETFGEVQVYRFQYFIPKRLQKLTYGYGMPVNLRVSLLAKLQLPLYLFVAFFRCLLLARHNDIIHAHWTLNGLAGVMVKKISNKPLILTVRGSDLRLMPRIIIKFVLNNCNAIISPHPELTNYLNGYNVTNLVEIPNLINEEKFNENIDSSDIHEDLKINGKTVVTFVAGLNEFKDPITFIKSMPHVIKIDSSISFCVVGDGVLKDEIIDLVHNYELENHVFVLGNRNDVNKILNASTIFVALSPIENIWSNAIIEAMMCNIPCIITKSGTTEQYLTHEENAFLIPPKDEVALADAILTLATDVNLRIKLANGAKQLLVKNRFTSDTIIADTIEVYKKSLECV